MSDGFGIEALLDRASGAMIGWAGLAVPHSLPEILPAVEVGWRLAGAWRGRGPATEAGAAAVELASPTGGLERIVSIFEPDNVASGPRHGAPWVHPLPYHHGPAWRGDRGDRAHARHTGRRTRVMGDIAQQTAVEPAGDGRFTAMVHDDWEIWGPCGGYVVALALRVAGAESHLARPASFFCHYLSVASFAPVDLEVTPLRAGRTVRRSASSVAGGRPVLDAMVWSVGEVEGLEHEDVNPPGCARPRHVADVGRHCARRGPTTHGLRDNFDQRPISWSKEWPPPGPMTPTWRAWCACSRQPPSNPLGGCGAHAHCARRGELAPARGRTCTPSRPTLRRAWTSTPRSSTPEPIGLAVARRPFSGGPRRAVVVDRQGVVTRAPVDRERRRTGSFPSHLAAPAAPPVQSAE